MTAALPRAQWGDVDANGDIVGLLLLPLIEERFPRTVALTSAIEHVESLVPLDEYLALIAAELARVKRGPLL